MVRSVTHACELLRLRCGSMRRPFSLHLAAADDFTFAFHRDDKLHLYRWDTFHPDSQNLITGPTSSPAVLASIYVALICLYN